ncbi:MAG: glycosyltransferase family 39 protein [Anaerolineae bacterium]|nr:glycosyltransferase family 39 protein [Anaerolineae bacterium]
MIRWQTLLALISLVALRLLLAGWFATMTPLWEYFDEVNHYYVAQYRGGIDDTLPQNDWAEQYQIFNQFNQPPLYHFFVGRLIRPFSQAIPTPIGNPPPFCLNPQPNNFYIHNLDAETPFAQPYRGIWLARSITILVGAISVIGVWFAARLLWSQFPNRAWIATLLYALFSPAIALSTWFNNDAPLMLIGVLALILLAQALKSGFSWRALASLIVIFIIGIGIKINTIALAPALFFVVLERWIFRSKQGRIRRLTLMILGIILLGVIFAGVNVAICGQSMCRTHRALTLENFTVLTNPFINQYTLPSLQQLLETLGAPSANPAYSSPDWIVTVVWIVLGVGMVSIGLSAWESPDDRKALILLFVISFSALGLGLLRVWWLGIAFLPARYLALAFPALILIIAAGYDFLRLRLHWLMSLLPALIFLAANVIAIQYSYAPLWQMPEKLPQVPENITLSDMQFENGLNVVGFSVDEDIINLYLSTNEVLQDSLALEVTMLDGGGQILSHCELLAGSPLWSTSNWRVNEIVVQPVLLPELSSVLDTMYVRIRLIALQNDVFVDTIPDYENEILTLSDSNWIVISPDNVSN